MRTLYCANKAAGQWRAHGRYIARESGGGVALSGEKNRAANPATELERWQSEGDPRLWKLIVSPEFGERVDLEKLTRNLMLRMEKDLGTKLQWVAVTHFNTEHPHVHVALRGIRDDNTPLNLSRDYVRRGIRAIAEDLCTRELGYRNQLDALASEKREVEERRYTSLDRAIARHAQSEEGPSLSEQFLVPRPSGHTMTAREQHIDARLIVLHKMGLAEAISDREWLVRRDFETVLKAMQRTSDRQKTLAAHGALLSDERLPLVVLDTRKLKIVEGRILGHGEDETGRGAGKHYLLLEGTDAKVHLIYYTPEMEEARSRGKLRANSFVRLKKQFENGRPVLEVRDEGDAEKLLRNRQHFAERARTAESRQVTLNATAFGGWLGRYHAMLLEPNSRRGRPPASSEKIDQRTR